MEAMDKGQVENAETAWCGRRDGIQPARAKTGPGLSAPFRDGPVNSGLLPAFIFHSLPAAGDLETPRAA